MEYYGIIYKITNSSNGKSYVGQTTQKIGNRWKAHCKFSNGIDTEISRAIKKYGKECFIIEKICECKTKEILDIMETFKIIVSRSYMNENGYNMSWGGDGNRHSEEVKRKMSLSHKGKKFTIEHKRKISEAHKGKKISDKTKKKLSEINKGRVPPNKGIPMSDFQKQKISLSCKGKKVSDNTRKKLSEIRKGKNHPMYGKKHTEETKRKISETKKQMYKYM